jgi:hypothetical protein
MHFTANPGICLLRRISSAWEDELKNPTNALAAFIAPSDSAKFLNAIFVTKFRR